MEAKIATSSNSSIDTNTSLDIVDYSQIKESVKNFILDERVYGRGIKFLIEKKV